MKGVIWNYRGGRPGGGANHSGGGKCGPDTMKHPGGYRERPRQTHYGGGGRSCLGKKI